MSQADLIRKLQTLGPSTDYAKLLHNEFNVDVPATALKYQQEFLYKYMLKDKFAGLQFDAETAAQRVEELVKKYPHVLVKYEDTAATVKGDMARPVKTGEARKTYRGLHDGFYVVFSESRKLFLGFNGDKPLTAKPTMEAVKTILTTKFGATEVKEIA